MEKDREIVSIISNSKEAVKGCLFVCIKGLHTDSHALSPEAVASGADCVLVEEGASFERACGVVYLSAPSTRRALSMLFHAWYGFPTRRLKIIGVTGTNGKTTTTSLIYHLLKNAGMNVGLGGNIGKSYAYQVATEHHDIYVLELSSFQLDNVYDFKADIAIITNITPDHLDRYDHKMENYVKAKFRITRNMSSDDCFIFCSDDEITINHLNKIVIKAQQLPFTQKTEVEQGAFVKDDRIVVRYKEEECNLFLQELALGGKHNIYNSMAAALAAKAMDIDNQAIREGLATFQAVEHRLEKVLSIKDVLYINDSKATNVDAAWYALECQTRPVVWIVGGTDKGNDYSTLVPLVKEKVKAVICLGVDNTKIHNAFGEHIDRMYDVTSAQDAVKKAHAIAQPGDVVLLSPCCASFDLFKNYEDRGRQFKEAVRNL